MVKDGSLCLSEVGRSFGGVAAAVALNLSLERGRVLAVIGPNGAGKTTLINLATGLLTPDTGTVTVDGADLSGRPARAFARAGVVRTFQSVRLFEGMTVRENVLVGAARGQRVPLVGALVRSPRFRRNERLLRELGGDALDVLALGALADRIVAELSQGQRRRVEFARAMAARPQYLVLDEPGAGVDRDTVALLIDAINGFARDGIGVLIVEHDAQLLSQVAQDAAAMVSGRIVRAGSYAEVADQADIAAQLAAGT